MRSTRSSFIIFGGGGHAKVVLDTARMAGIAVRWVVDSDPKTDELLGVRVIGESDVRLAGNVAVGDGTVVGTGAAVLPGVVIGDGCVVGAGAVVNRDLPKGIVAYGIPARVQRKVESRPMR